MAKPNPLAQGLEQITKPAADPMPVRAAPKAAGNRPAQPPTRQGRVLVGGFFAPEVQRALKVIAAEEGTTLQALLTEGINTVFAQRGRPEIAGLPPKATA